MKVTSILRLQYRKKTGRILDLLEKPEQVWTTDDFHILRVEIKKVMALLHLVKTCDPNVHFKKQIRAIKAIYASAGEVRELQLEMESLSNLNLLEKVPGYIEILTRQLQLAQEAFRLQKGQPLKKEISKAFKNKFLRHLRVKQKKIKKFLAHSRLGIQKILGNPETDRIELHDLRKQIKNLLFLERLFKSAANDNPLLEQLQEKIGAWHDAVVMHVKLEKALKELQLDPREQIILEEQLNLIDLRSENLQQEINLFIRSSIINPSTHQPVSF